MAATAAAGERPPAAARGGRDGRQPRRMQPPRRGVRWQTENSGQRPTRRQAQTNIRLRCGSSLDQDGRASPTAAGRAKPTPPPHPPRPRGSVAPSAGATAAGAAARQARRRWRPTDGRRVGNGPDGGRPWRVGRTGRTRQRQRASWATAAPGGTARPYRERRARTRGRPAARAARRNGLVGAGVESHWRMRVGPVVLALGALSPLLPLPHRRQRTPPWVTPPIYARQRRHQSRPPLCCRGGCRSASSRTPPAAPVLQNGRPARECWMPAICDRIPKTRFCQTPTFPPTS